MTQALPNPSEGISNYLDNYLEVSNVNDNSLVIAEIFAGFWGFCKVLDSNDSNVTTSFYLYLSLQYPSNWNQCMLSYW